MLSDIEPMNSMSPHGEATAAGASNDISLPPVPGTPGKSKADVMGEEVKGGSMLTVEEEALLLRQCRLCKVELVEKALDSGQVKSDFQFSNGDSLLITACKSGFKRLAKAVIRRGAPLDAVDLDGNTAAHWCFAMGNPDLAEYLISKGASDRITNKTGNTCRNWKSMGHAEEDEEIHEPAAQRMQTFDTANQDQGRVFMQAETGAKKKAKADSVLPSELLKRKKEAQAATRALHAKSRTSVEESASPYQHMYLEPRSEAASLAASPIQTAMGEMSPGRKSKLKRRHGSPIHRGEAGSPTENHLSDGGDSSIRPLREDNASPHEPQNELPEGGAMPPVVRRKSNIAASSPTPQDGEPTGKPAFASTQFAEAVNDPDAPKTLLNFEPRRPKGSPEEIKSPRSVEAMRRLGILEEDLLETSKELLAKQYRGDTKVIEMRFKLYEERRLEDLQRCVKERARMLARSRDASLNVLFTEFSNAKNTMNLTDLLHLLETLTILSTDEWEARKGQISKTRAVEIFKEHATRRGTQFELTWGEFVRMEKQIAAVMGVKSISTKAGLTSQLTTQRSTRSVAASSMSSMPPRGNATAGSALPEGPTKMEQMLSHYEKLHQAELRRMKKHFSKVLDVRAKHSDFEQAVRDKEQLRLERLEARTFAMAEQRVDQQMKHVERVMHHEERLAVRLEEERARIARKEAEAKQLIEERAKREQEKARMQGELLKVKQEMTQLQRTQAQRKEEYLRQLVHDRLEKDRLRAQERAAQQEGLLRERSRILQKNRIDKKNFGAAANVFEKTGELRMPQGIKDLGQFNELIHHQPVEDWEDRNAEAEQLSMEAWTSRSVKKGCYAYFKVAVSPCKQIKFRARKPGHAELFVGNHECPFPTRETHTWSKSGHDRLTVMHLDPSFNLGYMYVGLYSPGADCSFSIIVTSIDDSTDARKGKKRAPETAGAQSASGQAAGKEDEHRVLQRVKERVEALVEQRLEGKDPEFVDKFRLLFGDSRGPGTTAAKAGKPQRGVAAAGEAEEEVRGEAEGEESGGEAGGTEEEETQDQGALSVESPDEAYDEEFEEADDDQ